MDFLDRKLTTSKIGQLAWKKVNARQMKIHTIAVLVGLSLEYPSHSTWSQCHCLYLVVDQGCQIENHQFVLGI